MAKAKKAADLEIEKEKTRRIVKIIESITSVVRTAIQYGFIYLSVKVIYEIVVAVAGKETNAHIAISFLSKVLINGEINTTLNLSGWVIGLSFGYYQLQARRKDVARLTARNTELEKIIDPSRSSSNLTSTGSTRPEDI